MTHLKVNRFYFRYMCSWISRPTSSTTSHLPCMSNMCASPTSRSKYHFSSEEPSCPVTNTEPAVLQVTLSSERFAVSGSHVNSTEFYLNVYLFGLTNGGVSSSDW